MFSKCSSCFRALSWRLLGHAIPKWQSHIQAFCSARAQKQPWCEMFLDNFDLIAEHTLPKQVENHIRNTNVASEITTIITNHYQQENNLFRFCIQLFGSYLKLKYSQTINPSKNTLNRIANQYQDFNKLLIDLFVLYFGLQDRQITGQQVFYKSNLPALANHFAFQNMDLETTINRIAKMAHKNQIDKMQFQIQRFTSVDIDEFELKQELQLNKNSLSYFGIQNGKPEQKLYSGAVQIIKEVVRVNSPAEKIKLLEGLPRQIQSSIMGFYKKNKIPIDKVDLSIQDLTAIFIYVIVQANSSVFFAHLQIAILFSPPSNRAESTLKALLNAFQTIQNGSIVYREIPILLSENSSLAVRKSFGSTPAFFDEVTNVDL